MKFTLTDTEVTLKSLIASGNYELTGQRFEDVNLWIGHTTENAQLYCASSAVYKNGVLEDLITETRPYQKDDILIIDQENQKFENVRLSAGTGQTITLYIDVRY